MDERRENGGDLKTSCPFEGEAIQGRRWPIWFTIFILLLTVMSLGSFFFISYEVFLFVFKMLRDEPFSPDGLAPVGGSMWRYRIAGSGVTVGLAYWMALAFYVRRVVPPSVQVGLGIYDRALGGVSFEIRPGR